MLTRMNLPLSEKMNVSSSRRPSSQPLFSSNASEEHLNISSMDALENDVLFTPSFNVSDGKPRSNLASLSRSTFRFLKSTVPFAQFRDTYQYGYSSLPANFQHSRQASTSSNLSFNDAAGWSSRRLRRLCSPASILTWFVLTILFVVIFHPFSYFSHHPDIPTHQPPPVSSPNPKEPTHYIISSNGAVATDHPICSNMSINILKQGGSAIDASIAAGICLGVVNPYNSGIGGGGFLVYRPSLPGNATFINFREKSGLKSTQDMFDHDDKASLLGGLSVAVPGEIRGYEYMHKRFGKLPWEKLFEPFIELCENGFPVSKTLSKYIQHASEYFQKFPGLKEALTGDDGKLLVENDIWKRKRLGQTLRKIAKEGADVFYVGSIMTDLVTTLRENQSILTDQDFQKYDAIESEPLVGWVHGRKVLTAPPPASGAVLLSMMNIMEGYQVHSQDNLTVHQTIEAFKHAFAQRSYYGDPKGQEKVMENVRQFISKDHAAHIRQKIVSNATFEPKYYGHEFSQSETHGTTHISIIGPNQEAVSMTLTINTAFGSKIVCQRTGIILNNQMDDFAVNGRTNGGSQKGLPPSPYNLIQPERRPFSSTCPTIIEEDDSLGMVIGGAGGSHIPTAVYQTYQNIYEYIENHEKEPSTVYQAVQRPRLHHQLFPNLVTSEFDYDEDLIEALKLKGHQIHKLAENKSGGSTVNVVMRTRDGLLHASSDERKGGIAAGF